jgi:hypothetical protein
MDDDRQQIMQGNGQGLVEFYERMGARGSLNQTTAAALRTTARKVLAVESPDLASIELRVLDIDDLFNRFVNLHKADYSEGSLDTYRSRFRLAVAMYLAWLADDPNWKTAGRATAKRQGNPGNGSRPSSNRRPRPSKSDSNASEHALTTTTDEATPAAPVDPSVRLMTYDVPLRPNLIVRVTLPLDLTTDDADRLANFVRVLAFSGRTGSENSLSGHAATESRAEGSL